MYSRFHAEHVVPGVDLIWGQYVDGLDELNEFSLAIVLICFKSEGKENCKCKNDKRSSQADVKTWKIFFFPFLLLVIKSVVVFRTEYLDWKQTFTFYVVVTWNYFLFFSFFFLILPITFLFVCLFVRFILLFCCRGLCSTVAGLRYCGRWRDTDIKLSAYYCTFGGGLKQEDMLENG